MRLVVGATGLLGGEICRLLAENGEAVRALVRASSDQEKVNVLVNRGIELAKGDLKERSSLEAACQDAATVISTASATLSRQDGDSLQTIDLEGQLALVDAAKEAGVEHFVYVSFRTGENPALQHPLKAAKRAVEQHLIESGLSYTILQPSYFMEVWLSPALGFDYALAKARIYGSGQNPISWISVADVAHFAVAAIDNAAARNVTLELGGPEALSPREVVRIFGEIKAQEFAVEHVPEEALQAQKTAATDALSETFAALMLQYAAGDAIEMEKTLNAFPRQLVSVRDYAKRVVADL